MVNELPTGLLVLADIVKDYNFAQLKMFSKGDSSDIKFAVAKAYQLNHPNYSHKEILSRITRD